jgi:hypothetical protein
MSAQTFYGDTTMKLKVLVTLTAGILSAGSAQAADFTVEELHKSSLAATETFKSEYGIDLHDAIYGMQVTKGRESGRVKLFYRQADVAKNIEYFCHYHGGSDVIDCHEH